MGALGTEFEVLNRMNEFRDERWAGDAGMCVC